MHNANSNFTGKPLTNARTISRELLIDADRQHPELNLLFMQFGQLITHDVTQASMITTSDAKSINCCADDGSSILPPPFAHFGCMPIEVDPHDEFYSQFNQKCINFVRSSLAPDSECKLGYGKQVYGGRTIFNEFYLHAIFVNPITD